LHDTGRSHTADGVVRLAAVPIPVKLLILLAVNAAFFVLIFKLSRKKDLLSFFSDGKWWLTWLAVAVITLMDELTSIFYAPSEAYRYIGIQAVFFIAFTSIIMRFLSNRMVEISHILEENKLIGGGVYNFAYLVTGPVLSFVAVASILVDYVLTASISTVSAVENGLSLLSLGSGTKFIVELCVVWGVAGLNIMGIKENAKITFGIFVITAAVFVNFIISGFFEVTPENYQNVWNGSRAAVTHITTGGGIQGYYFMIASISSCILAYSGIESVLQTATLVKGWREIRKAYTFLALTVGIVTPLVTALVLSHSNIDFHAHETDLIPHYAAMLNGAWFGVIVSVLASVTLIMAVNTAYVASSELIERVAHRYGFYRIIKTNRFDSLYIIHIANATFYTTIIFITNGQQALLAEMYALGLVASFVINMGALLVYRYQKGHTEAQGHTTSRLGTFILFTILLSCFIYLVVHKPYGTVLWFSATTFALIVGVMVGRRRSPEIKAAGQGDSSMDLIMYLGAQDQKNVNIYFKRPNDQANLKTYGVSVYVTFYSTRKPIPPKLAENHFRLPVRHMRLHQKITALLTLVGFEMPGYNVTVHFGWPTSNWLDRISVGVQTFQLMKLPMEFPKFNFRIEQFYTEEP
jgi:amino acid transporter